jgi:hypothetical protein
MQFRRGLLSIVAVLGSNYASPRFANDRQGIGDLGGTLRSRYVSIGT